MKKTIIAFLSVLLFPSFSQAAIKDITIDGVRWINSYATISGRVESEGEFLVLVTVNNAGIKYTTVVSQDGMWSVVFKPFDTSVTAEAFAPLSTNHTQPVEESFITASQDSPAAESFSSHFFQPCSFWRYANLPNGQGGYVCAYAGISIDVPDAQSLQTVISGLEDRIRRLEAEMAIIKGR